MTDEPLVLREDRDGIATLTFDRPERRNALSLAMLRALDAELLKVAEDPGIRVVVLAGNGPAFSSGHDLAELRDADATTADEIFRTCSQVMLRIGSLPKPVIAAVEGIATAAGCQLVASCDLAVAGSSARFATPGVNIGLFCSTPAVPIVRSLAPKHAMQLLLTGELVSADEAFRMGLVNEVVADGAVEAAVMELAETLASKPPQVVAAGKAALRRQASMPIDDAYAFASAEMVEGLTRPDAIEGIGAFLDKRTPTWND